MKKTIISLVLCIALAMGLGLTATSPAGANIIYQDYTSNPKVILPNNSSTYLNLNLDGVSRLQVNATSSSTNLGLATVYIQGSGLSNLISGNNNVNVALGHYETLTTLPVIGAINAPVMDNLSAGTTIIAGSGLTQLPPYTIPLINVTIQVSGFVGNLGYKPLGGSATYYGPFGEFDITWGYAGFQFQDTDGIHYGWIHGIGNYNNSTHTLTNVTIDGYAYNTVAGQSILAGQTVVPIPASALLLGSGLMGLGLLGWRRQGKSIST